MTIEYQIEDRGQYLHFHCWGDFEQGAVSEVFQSALKAAASQGRQAVLLDVTNMGGKSPTTMERYELGKRVAEMQSSFSPVIRIAVAGHEPLIDKDRFGETVGRNRGAIGKVFTDLDQAVAWILSGTNS